MLVRDLMEEKLITVTEKTMVGDALDLIKKHDVRHLPVINKDSQLVGITSETDLLKVFPRCSCDTSKKSFEINLLSRTPVANVMIPNPHFINPDIAVEEAALIMKENKIGCLPVVEDGQVVGLISRTDIIEAFIDSLGLSKHGVRLTIPYIKKMGFLSELVILADRFGVIIDHMVTFDREIVLKVQPDKVEPFLKELKSAGYTVTDMTCIKESSSKPCA